MKQGMIVAAAVTLVWSTVCTNSGTCRADMTALVKQVSCCIAGDSMHACTKCGVLTAKDGQCATCGTALKSMHLLSMKDGVATVCPCEAGCTCKANPGDPTKCGCGKPVMTMKCAASCPKVDVPKVDVPKVEIQ